MSIQAPDFAELFGSEAYSDVNVLLYEESEGHSSTPTRPHKRQRQAAAEEVLPCHRIVLRALSQYFKTKLDNWSHQQQQPAADGSAERSNQATRTSKDQDAAAAAAGQQPSKQQIKLPVPSGQLLVGRLLLKSMYEAQPALSDVSQAQLVQLIMLADRYEVPKVAAAAAAVLGALPKRKLQWETVFTVYRLPEGCAGMEHVSSCRM